MRPLVAAFAAALALAAPAPTPAHAAGLDGTTLTLQYNFTGFPSSTDSLTVGPGAEVTCPGGFGVCFFLSAPTQTVDIGGLTIHYEYNGPVPAGFNPIAVNEFLFSNLAPGGDIVGVTLTTNFANLDQSDVSFTADSVTLNMSGASAGTSGFFDLTLEIPEPASLAALGFAVASLVPLRRRRRALS